jgi:hypothetical protein
MVLAQMAVDSHLEQSDMADFKRPAIEATTQGTAA